MNMHPWPGIGLERLVNAEPEVAESRRQTCTAREGFDEAFAAIEQIRTQGTRRGNDLEALFTEPTEHCTQVGAGMYKPLRESSKARREIRGVGLGRNPQKVDSFVAEDEPPKEATK